MQIHIQTHVKADFETVSREFGQPLLEYVSPPFPPARLVRYDGNQPGGEVHVELNFIFFRQLWKSTIVSYQKNDTQMVFVDTGKVLPFFLSHWHHTHQVTGSKTGSCITDQIEFRTPFVLTDYLMYPLMYAQFLYRKPRYRKFFSRS